jgi:hypothetical protein
MWRWKVSRVIGKVVGTENPKLWWKCLPRCHFLYQDTDRNLFPYYHLRRLGELGGRVANGWPRNMHVFCIGGVVEQLSKQSKIGVSLKIHFQWSSYNSWNIQSICQLRLKGWCSGNALARQTLFFNKKYTADIVDWFAERTCQVYLTS